jgi:recombination protein RecT
MAENNTQLQVARKQIVQLLESQKAQITMALPKHLTADRLIRIATTEMSKNPKLYECSQTSVLACIIMAAQLGLEIGINGQAYLVPYFDKKQNVSICQFIPGWQGYVDLVARAGRASVWTGAVREGDEFAYQLGAKPNIHHIPSDDDTGKFTHVYACGQLSNSQFVLCEVWSRAKVLKHLSAYNKVGDRHYALQNENNLEMYGRKVALLQVLKYMPKSIEMQNVQSMEHRAEEGLQHLTVSGDPRNPGIIDADFIDISSNVEETRQTIDEATTRTKQVSAVVSAARKDSKAKAEQAVQEAQPQTQQKSEPEPHDEPQQSQAEPVNASLW